MIVYLLSNPLFAEGLVKIGQTSNLPKRLQDLYKTGVPAPFRCEYAVEVDGALADEVESRLHAVFAPQRITKNREFFKVGVAQAIAAMQLTGGRNVTPGQDVDEYDEGVEAAERAASRPPFRFRHAGLKPGDEIVYIRDRGVTATVADDQNVAFGGETMTLHQATGIALKGSNLNWVSWQGAGQWKYGDETLLDIRLRLEQELIAGREADACDNDVGGQSPAS